MAMTNLYVGKPKIGETISTSRYGVVTVLATKHYGQTLTCKHSDGREVTVTRTENGLWCRAKNRNEPYRHWVNGFHVAYVSGDVW